MSSIRSRIRRIFQYSKGDIFFRYFLRVTTGVIFTFLPLFSTQAFAQSNVEELRKSVVKIYNFGPKGAISTGTGFVVSPDGHVVTNNHVTTGARKLFVVTNNTMKPLEATLINTSREVDLSILEVPKLRGKAPALTLNYTKNDAGTKVWAIGYPAAANSVKSIERRAISTTTDGIISRSYNGTWGGGGTIRVIQHNAPISGGNSGGPLFNDCNQVVGVNTMIAAVRVGRNKITAPQGVFYASHILESIRLLDNSGVNIRKTNIKCSVATAGVPSVSSDEINKTKIEIKKLEDQIRRKDAQRIEDDKRRKAAEDKRIADQAKKDAEEKAFQKRLFIGLGAAIALLSGLTLAALIFAMKKPKHPFVRSMSRMVGMSAPVGTSRSVPKRNDKPQSSSQRGSNRNARGSKALGLSGFSNDGHKISLNVSARDLESPHGFSFGRSRDFVDQVLDDDAISKRHFRIKMERGNLVIEDLNSTNGTYVSGTRLSPYNPQKLRRNDRITIGGLELDVNI